MDGACGQIHPVPVYGEPQRVGGEVGEEPPLRCEPPEEVGARGHLLRPRMERHDAGARLLVHVVAHNSPGGGRRQEPLYHNLMASVTFKLTADEHAHAASEGNQAKLAATVEAYSNKSFVRPRPPRRARARLTPGGDSRWSRPPGCLCGRGGSPRCAKRG